MAVKLPRAPGSKEARYAHLLSGTPEVVEAQAVSDPPSDLVGRPSQVERIGALESEVAALRNDVADLRGQLAEFRSSSSKLPYFRKTAVLDSGGLLEQDQPR